MELKHIKQIKGTFELITGTRVGGNSDIIEIGGNDNPVVRNPLTKELYIPGSSLKGKMRMMTEWLYGKVEEEGEVHSCNEGQCKVCRVFGRKAQNGEQKAGEKKTAMMARLSVKDAFLTKESASELIDLKKEIGVDTEWKYENSINRLTSKASPRNSERIPSGVSFDFSMSYKVFDCDEREKNDEKLFDEKLFEEIVLKAIRILELEGVGGGVSRGNGQIKITQLTVDGENYLEEMQKIKI